MVHPRNKPRADWTTLQTTMRLRGTLGTARAFRAFRPFVKCAAVVVHHRVTRVKQLKWRRRWSRLSRAGTLIFFNSNEIEFGTTYAEACCRIRVGPLSSHSQTRLKPDLLIRSLCLILSLAYNWLLISLGPGRDFRRGMTQLCPQAQTRSRTRGHLP